MEKICSSRRWYLSAALRFDFNTYKGRRSIAPVSNILSGTGFTSNVNGLTVKTVNTKLPKAMEVVGGLKSPQLAYLELPEDQLDNGLQLLRIDGNHRLSAVEGAGPSEAKYNLPTPFCIVLHDEDSRAQRFERVVFHNINAKQIPLTSEENLRLILETSEGGSLFGDKTLLESPNFGPAYYLARKLLDEIDDRYLDEMRRPLEKRRSLVLALAHLLIEKGEIGGATVMAELDAQVPRLRRAFINVSAIYGRWPKLRENACHGVLIAFLYFALHNDGRKLAAFARWVTSNRIDHLAPVTTTNGTGYHYHLGHIQAVDAASLVRVFESILAGRRREIFVAMAFREETEETYRTIKKTIQQINEKYLLDIRLREIRIDQLNRGHSYTIDDEILRAIEDSGLLIADLTFGNRNVYHEVGYLMGLNRGKGLEQSNFILIADEKARSESLESEVGFNLKSWQQLRFKSTRQLEEALTKAVEICYHLGGEE